MNRNISISPIFRRMASGRAQVEKRVVTYKGTIQPTRFPTVHNPVRSAYKPHIQLPKGLVFNPAPTPLSPYDTVNIFLPENDPRTVRYESKDYPVELMPPITSPPAKSYHLTEKDAKEIQKLRLQDPEKWTRKALAAYFRCSELTVSLVSAPSHERMQEMDRRLSIIKSIWNPRRAHARLDRKRRQEIWKQDKHF